MATISETQTALQERRKQISEARQQVEEFNPRIAIPQRVLRSQVNNSRDSPQLRQVRIKELFQRRGDAKRGAQEQITQAEQEQQSIEQEFASYMGSDAGKAQFAVESGYRSQPVYKRNVLGDELEVGKEFYDPSGNLFVRVEYSKVNPDFKVSAREFDQGTGDFLSKLKQAGFTAKEFLDYQKLQKFDSTPLIDSRTGSIILPAQEQRMSYATPADIQRALGGSVSYMGLSSEYKGKGILGSTENLITKAKQETISQRLRDESSIIGETKSGVAGLGNVAVEYGAFFKNLPETAKNIPPFVSGFIKNPISTSSQISSKLSDEGKSFSQLVKENPSYVLGNVAGEAAIFFGGGALLKKGAKVVNEVTGFPKYETRYISGVKNIDNNADFSGSLFTTRRKGLLFNQDYIGMSIGGTKYVAGDDVMRYFSGGLGSAARIRGTNLRTGEVAFNKPFNFRGAEIGEITQKDLNILGARKGKIELRYPQEGFFSKGIGYSIVDDSKKPLFYGSQSYGFGQGNTVFSATKDIPLKIDKKGVRFSKTGRGISYGFTKRGIQDDDFIQIAGRGSTKTKTPFSKTFQQVIESSIEKQVIKTRDKTSDILGKASIAPTLAPKSKKEKTLESSYQQPVSSNQFFQSQPMINREDIEYLDNRFGLGTKNNEKLDSFFRSSQGNIQQERERTITIPKQNPIVVPRERITPISLITPRPRQGQPPREAQRPRNALTPRNTFRPQPPRTRNPLIPLRVPKKLKSNPSKINKRSSSFESFFLAETKRKGKWLPVARSKDFKDVFFKGLKKVDRSLGASLRVRETRSGRTVPLPLAQKFRRSKRNKSVLVEKRSYRLSTPEEIFEIKKSKQRKSLFI